MDSGTKKALMTFSVVVFLILFGTVGYVYILNVNILDALYMTVITLSTVGFKEIVDLTPAAKIFTMIIIFGGLSTAAYAFTNLASFLFEGKLNDILRRRKMENKISALKDHYILCGAGQTGLSVISRFQRSKASFVVIEKDEDRVNELLLQGVITLHGDATQECVLEKARISYAKGLVTCLSSDADNVFTVLTARGMNADLHIISRAINANSHGKLRKAGANNAVSPNELGGTRMASLLLRPIVVSFLDIITHVGDVILDLEEVEISKYSTFIGNTLKEAGIPKKTGLNVLAIKKNNENNLRFNPESQEILDEGDKLLVLGQEGQIDLLRAIASNKQVEARLQ